MPHHQQRKRLSQSAPQSNSNSNSHTGTNTEEPSSLDILRIAKEQQEICAHRIRERDTRGELASLLGNFSEKVERDYEQAYHKSEQAVKIIKKLSEKSERLHERLEEIEREITNNEVKKELMYWKKKEEEYEKIVKREFSQAETRIKELERENKRLKEEVERLKRPVQTTGRTSKAYQKITTR